MQYFRCHPAILPSCHPAILPSCHPAILPSKSVRAEPITKAWFSNLHFLYCCFLLLTGLLLGVHPVQAGVKAGDILVFDLIGGTDQRGALVVVDATTGQRTMLSDLGDAAQGSLGLIPTAVAVFRCRSDKYQNGESEHRNSHRCTDGEAIQIFVSDFFAGSGGSGVLFNRPLKNLLATLEF